MAILRRFQDILRDAELTIEGLENVGVTVPPSSRYRQYVRFLSRVLTMDGSTPLRDVLRDWHQTCVELDELRVITRALSSPNHLAGWLSTASKIISGPFHDATSPHSSARDIQFELLLASLFRSARLEPELAEPDVRITFRGRVLGIAAKRLSSPKKLGRRLRDAEKQLARAGLPGIIAVDLTQIVGSVGFIKVGNLERELTILQEQYTGFIDENRTIFEQEAQPQRALGMMFYTTRCVIDDSSSLSHWRPLGVSPFLSTIPDDVRLLEELTSALEPAWRTMWS